MIFNSLLVPLLTLIIGLVIGLFVEYCRFRHNIQIERIKTLSPILYEVYPIVEKIVGACNYALNVRQRNDKIEFIGLIETLCLYLEEYRMWDEKYR